MLLTLKRSSLLFWVVHQVLAADPRLNAEIQSKHILQRDSSIKCTGQLPLNGTPLMQACAALFGPNGGSEKWDITHEGPVWTRTQGTCSVIVLMKHQTRVTLKIDPLTLRQIQEDYLAILTECTSERKLAGEREVNRDLEGNQIWYHVWVMGWPDRPDYQFQEPIPENPLPPDRPQAAAEGPASSGSTGIQPGAAPRPGRGPGQPLSPPQSPPPGSHPGEPPSPQAWPAAQAVALRPVRQFRQPESPQPELPPFRAVPLRPVGQPGQPVSPPQALPSPQAQASTPSGQENRPVSQPQGPVPQSGAVTQPQGSMPVGSQSNPIYQPHPLSQPQPPAQNAPPVRPPTRYTEKPQLGPEITPQDDSQSPPRPGPPSRPYPMQAPSPQAPPYRGSPRFPPIPEQAEDPQGSSPQSPDNSPSRSSRLYSYPRGGLTGQGGSRADLVAAESYHELQTLVREVNDQVGSVGDQVVQLMNRVAQPSSTPTRDTLLLHPDEDVGECVRRVWNTYVTHGRRCDQCVRDNPGCFGALTCLGMLGLVLGSGGFIHGFLT
ncbi:hypothetical protein MMC13_006950 [Lambiella insularis]|nr:hypothetical protein [Lambiella insularis]